jgi:hypothetical protein
VLDGSGQGACMLLLLLLPLQQLLLLLLLDHVSMQCLLNCGQQQPHCSTATGLCSWNSSKLTSSRAPQLVSCLQRLTAAVLLCSCVDVATYACRFTVRRS